MVGTRDMEVKFVVNDVCSVAVALIDAVVFPKHIDEECLHNILTVCHDWVDALHEVGVVHHHL